MVLVRIRIALALCGLCGLLQLLSGCERAQSVQRDYRGLGMVQIDSPAKLQAQAQVNQVPVPLRKVSSAGPTAAESYENVQVLGDLSKPEFARLMLSFKTWVAKDEGCDYCHNAPDYASDDKYPKLVARKMIEMTRRINTDWQAHVKTTGVTCYTCHRGMPVPPKVWVAVNKPAPSGLMPSRAVTRAPTPGAATTALAVDPLSDFLLDSKPIRVVTTSALPTDNAQGIATTRSTYELMMVMSESLGVNCTFCHNTRAFFSWETSSPQRVTAWYGLRMAHALNKGYIAPLTGLLPAAHLGPAGDVPKVYCATCHLGSSKPLNGANMVQHFPELRGPKPMANPPEAAASAPGPLAALAPAQAVAQR